MRKRFVYMATATGCLLSERGGWQGVAIVESAAVWRHQNGARISVTRAGTLLVQVPGPNGTLLYRLQRLRDLKPHLDEVEGLS